MIVNATTAQSSLTFFHGEGLKPRKPFLDFGLEVVRLDGGGGKDAAPLLNEFTKGEI